MSTPIQDINSIGKAGEAPEQEDKRSQAQIDYEEGRGYVERGEAALAAVALHNALLGFEEENNQEGIANASNQFGHACLMRQEYDKALVHYQRAWEICEAMEDPMSLLAIAGQLVEAHKGLKDYPKAIELSFYLLDSYQQNNDPKNSVAVLEKLAEVYIAAGELEKASDAYKTAASVHANFGHEKIAAGLRQKAAGLLTGKR
jgi:tetratricopeptide (TPR) repeat protein